MKSHASTETPAGAVIPEPAPATGGGPLQGTVTRDWLGSLIGLGVFLGGIGLLIIVFRLSFDMFSVPPRIALDIQPGKSIDVSKAGDSITAIISKVVLLIIMAATGSLVANRGIHLYGACRQIPK